MASIIKADNIQKVSDGSNIIKKCGSTITLGSCGATISLAAGATQTGFGQTYSAVEYCTTAKTSPFTAAAGTGYFINTTCGAVTVTLPASPTVGDVIAFKDYAGQWNTNAVILCNNGNKINGVCATAGLSTQNQSVSLIYVDATKGWQDIQDSSAAVTGNDYITATGGTIVTNGDFKTHIFTSDGSFSISAVGNPANAVVDYLVVAGGAGGGGSPVPAGGMGGGGAGGFRLSAGQCIPAPTMSPLGACVARLPVSVQSYPIIVGGGGTAGPATVTPPNNCQQGGTGGNSVFSTITSAGGGGGGSATTRIPNGSPCAAEGNGVAGGSGGGGSYRNPGRDAIGGAGNTPPVSPPQGNPGGQACGAYAPDYPGSGGGGAGAVGGPGQPGNAGDGGVGSFIADPYIGPTAPSYGTPGPVGSVRYFAGGGGGGGSSGSGGSGGGAAGGSSATGSAGTPNTGGGGGGGGFAAGGAGGSGIVMIRYKFQ